MPVQSFHISFQAALCIVLLWSVSVYFEHVFICHNTIRFHFDTSLYVLTVNKFHSHWWLICNKFENFTQSILFYLFT